MILDGCKNGLPLVFRNGAANTPSSVGNVIVHEAREIRFDLFDLRLIDKRQLRFPNHLGDLLPNQLVEAQCSFGLAIVMFYDFQCVFRLVWLVGRCAGKPDRRYGDAEHHQRRQPQTRFAINKFRPRPANQPTHTTQQ